MKKYIILFSISILLFLSSTALAAKNGFSHQYPTFYLSDKGIFIVGCYYDKASKNNMRAVENCYYANLSFIERFYTVIPNYLFEKVASSTDSGAIVSIEITENRGIKLEFLKNRGGNLETHFLPNISAGETEQQVIRYLGL
ncbi:hypothetical protein C0584_01845 [Candidatus Parcubacteria bacterium]|nr:MAG: hypothetical protein C0584_01845 [Candidatus Parcubacteria bacterium]